MPPMAQARLQDCSGLRAGDASGSLFIPFTTQEMSASSCSWPHQPALRPA
ncbi:hypothetical protein FB597_10272 [Herbaspirillum sp. SJZ099]|nr:hypothetical protein FB597_10272 [Herbaspirillum sp. SJZ099]